MFVSRPRLACEGHPARKVPRIFSQGIKVHYAPQQAALQYDQEHLTSTDDGAVGFFMRRMNPYVLHLRNKRFHVQAAETTENDTKSLDLFQESWHVKTSALLNSRARSPTTFPA